MKRGIFAYATDIAFLISFERAYVVLANGAIGSVIAGTDPKLDTLKAELFPDALCKTAFKILLLIRYKMMTSLIAQSQSNQINSSKTIIIFTVLYIEQNGIFPVASIYEDRIYHKNKTEIYNGDIRKG